MIISWSLLGVNHYKSSGHPLKFRLGVVGGGQGECAEKAELHLSILNVELINDMCTIVSHFYNECIAGLSLSPFWQIGGWRDIKKHTLVAARGLDFELIEGNEFSSNRPWQQTVAIVMAVTDGWFTRRLVTNKACFAPGVFKILLVCSLKTNASSEKCID